MRLQQYLNESINDKGLLKSVIFGGLPASGKSTIIKKILSDGTYSIKVINTDKWTELYNGDYVNNRQKIKHLSRKEVLNGVNSLRPLYFDTVSSNMAIFKRRVQGLENLGYDTRMIFADISYDTAVERVIARNKRIKRQVDLSFVKQSFEKFYGTGKFSGIDKIPLFKQFQLILGQKNVIVVNSKNLSFNDTNKKVYNSVMRYLGSPLKNKKGKKLLDYMRKNGYKYYNEVPDEFLIGNGFTLLKDIKYY